MIAAADTARAEDLFSTEHFRKYSALIHSVIGRFIRQSPRLANENDEMESVGYLAYTKAIHSFDPTKARFSTFLYHCVHHELIKWARDRRIRLMQSLGDHTESMGYEEADSLAHVEDKEGRDRLMRDLQSAMAQLKRDMPRDYEVIQLRMQGWTFERVGQHMGFGKERARQLQVRAYEYLRQKLQDSKNLQYASIDV